MRQVQPHQMIALYRVARPDDEDTAENDAIESVVHEPDIPRLHIGVAVVYHDSLIAIWIVRRTLCIRATVPAHLTVMKSVEVNALAINLLKYIVAVKRAIDIPGRIYGNGKGMT